jgi:hyperosmotically inducible periplasmic protein
LQDFFNFAPTLFNNLRGITMNHNPTTRAAVLVCAFAALAGMTVLSTGCAVVRGQETAGAYVDDAGITAAVKAKMVEDKTVAASSISVETLNGTVQLSGFAKSAAEKSQAETIARNVKNVRSVRNDIVVRP